MISRYLKITLLVTALLGVVSLGCYFWRGSSSKFSGRLLQSSANSKKTSFRGEYNPNGAANSPNVAAENIDQNNQSVSTSEEAGAVTLGDNSGYFNSGNVSHSDDLREFQHGMDFVPLPDGNCYLIWSSSGNPPNGSNGGDWSHDIYYSLVNSKSPVIKPVALISKPEAQEPVSAAISSGGKILVTTEDGWNAPNEVAQRFALFNSDLGVIKNYPQSVMEGGHSGHVVAVGDRFVVFFSEGWVDGGGVDNLGTGDDVYAYVINSAGAVEKKVNIALGQARDWWPVAAGGANTAALVWQRYVNGKNSSDLYFSILDPETGNVAASSKKLASNVKYYTYNASYIKDIDRFLVLGAYASGGGFGYLIDQNGTVTASNATLPAVVRESQPAVSGSVVAQPASPNGLAVYDLTKESIGLRKIVADNYGWQHMGTDGIFIDSDTVYVVSLSSRGLVEKLFAI